MITIPYVIDNQQHVMADVLNALLAGHTGRSLDIATAYFNVHGFDLLKEGLRDLGSFRLLLGDEPKDGESIGLRPRAAGQLLGELVRRMGMGDAFYRLVKYLMGPPTWYGFVTGVWQATHQKSV